MKYLKLFENSESIMTPQNVYSIYDSNNNSIVELYLNESDSKNRSIELNNQYNTELYNNVTDKPNKPFEFDRFKSLLLSKAIEELEDYYSEVYGEQDESY